MIFPRQAKWWLACCAAGQLSGFALSAQDIAPPAPMKLFSTPTNLTPPLPRAGSPVDFFRQLLALPARDRFKLLTNRPPALRDRLLAKIHEYEAFGPDERELRLRATELRWYLMPLLRDSATDRTAQLALIPDDIRPLVQARLVEWSILPPPMQEEFLANERILHYFAHVEISNQPPALPSPLPLPPGAGGAEGPAGDQARWDALSEDARQAMAAQFNRFFELTPDEKQKTLNTLSEAERHQMEQTLQSFEKMPVSQRAECIRSFTKFASMSAQEQAEFLRNAERWSTLSPAERQAWRDLVVNVPQWPPLPTSIIMPPMPPQASTTHPVMATNKN